MTCSSARLTFTPPAGSLLVAMVASNGGTGVTTMTLSDTSGLGIIWAPAVENNPANSGYCGVWTARV